MGTFLTFAKNYLCPPLALASDYDRLPNEYFIVENYAINITTNNYFWARNKKGEKKKHVTFIKDTQGNALFLVV
jgi:hypothetical protein